MAIGELRQRLRSLNPEHVFSDIVDVLKKQLGADLVWMECVPRYGQTRLWQSRDVFESPPSEWPLSPCRTALDTGRLVRETGCTLSCIVPAKERLEFGRLICNPLALESGRLVLSVGWFHHHVITPYEEQIIALCTKLGGAAMENALCHAEFSSLYQGMVRAFLSALELRDFETIAHSRRVVTYTLILAERMGVARGLYEEFALGAALHDVGKIAISDAILRKPDKLTKVEYMLVQQHPVIGYDMLRSTLASHPIALEMVRNHHERYDGVGYPDKLAGKDIPFAARLLAVADAFDVMTNDRPYSRARSVEDAREEVWRCRGTQFCPESVDAFMSIEPAVLDAVRRGELDRMSGGETAAADEKARCARAGAAAGPGKGAW